MIDAIRCRNKAKILTIVLIAMISSTISANEWQTRGKALEEYPVCYQLWRCDGATVESTQGRKILPQGTWGLCEHYLTNQTTSQPQCGRCDAPKPNMSCLAVVPDTTSITVPPSSPPDSSNP